MEKKNNKRKIEGIVVSNKMQKTVRVLVLTKKRHPKYKKIVNVKSVFFAHTDKDLNEGDKVVITQSRPYSKNIKWEVK